MVVSQQRIRLVETGRLLLGVLLNSSVELVMSWLEFHVPYGLCVFPDHLLKFCLEHLYDEQEHLIGHALYGELQALEQVCGGLHTVVDALQGQQVVHHEVVRVVNAQQQRGQSRRVPVRHVRAFRVQQLHQNEVATDARVTQGSVAALVRFHVRLLQDQLRVHLFLLLEKI